MVDSARLTRSQWLWLLFIAVIPLLGWWTYGLFDLDEGFYAAVVSEMNRRGEWITPYYNGQPWFEKPILLYWVAKPFVALFGDMWGPRMPSVLANLGLYAMCGWYVARRIGATAGRLTVLVLASCLIMVALGRLMMTDPLLVLCQTAAFLSFYESLEGDRRWRLVTAVALGFAVLAKGPVAIMLFLPVAVWTFLAEPRFRPKFADWTWVWGFVLLVGVVSSWYLPAYLQHGDLFVQKFLVEQNLQRFSGTDLAHTAPLWTMPIYYPLILFVTMLPWSVYAIKFWPRSGTPAGTESPGSFEKYLARWAVVVLVFFSISSAKLPHYILPAVPPLAMLAAIGLARRAPNARFVPIKAAVTLVVVTLLANAGFLTWYRLSGQAEAHEIARFVKGKGPVAVYQMPRREAGLGTYKPKLQETSLPSLILYLDDTVIEAERLEDLVRPDPIWVITRQGRISTADEAKLVEMGMVASREIETQNYILYRIGGPPSLSSPSGLHDLR